MYIRGLIPWNWQRQFGLGAVGWSVIVAFPGCTHFLWSVRNYFDGVHFVGFFVGTMCLYTTLGFCFYSSEVILYLLKL